ncbi:MAG: hypothetical protein M0Z66_04085 [Thermaerobacter sp.]|nr:hypothetical protein [Thermaerobacter sp.]
MAAFRDKAEMLEIFGELGRRASASEAAKVLYDAGMVVAFAYHDPELTLVMDGRTPEEGGPAMIMHFDGGPRPDVTFTCSAEIGHRFWSGELDVTQALARGEITARGSIAKALRLLPLMPPLYEEYRSLRAQQSGERTP